MADFYVRGLSMKRSVYRCCACLERLESSYGHSLQHTVSIEHRPHIDGRTYLQVISPAFLTLRPGEECDQVFIPVVATVEHRFAYLSCEEFPL